MSSSDILSIIIVDDQGAAAPMADEFCSAKILTNFSYNFTNLNSSSVFEAVLLKLYIYCYQSSLKSMMIASKLFNFIALHFFYCNLSHFLHIVEVFLQNSKQ